MKIHLNKDIERAIEVGKEIHCGQKRKNGADYITHPLAVAEIAHGLYQQTSSPDIGYSELIISCILHDGVEDTIEWENKPLELVKYANFSNYIDRQTIVDALFLLNKNRYDSYLDFVLECKKYPISHIVKLADLTHNLSDLGRGNLREKYLLAKYILEN